MRELPYEEARIAPLRRPSWQAWALFLVAAALTAALRAPTLDAGLSWDETWTLRHAIHGKAQVASDGSELQFRPVPWLSTLWHYRGPTNHMAYSVAARLSLEAWHALSGAPRAAFSETALRVPAFLASMVAVVHARRVRDLARLPRAAPLACFLLAVHPWHIRYGAEGRGYSFVVLFVVGRRWFLLRALRGGRWRDWLGYAASVVLLLWSHPLAIYVPFALGVASLAAIWLPASGSREARLLRTGRLAVANLLAAMVCLQLMAPCALQVARFGQLLSGGHALGAGNARELWVILATGLSHRLLLPPEFAYASVAELFRAEPWRKLVTLGLLPALALLGAARVWRTGAGVPGRAVLLGLAAGVPLLFLHTQLQGFLALPRFATHGLVPVVSVLAIGFEGLVSSVRALRVRPFAAAAGLAVGLAGFAAFSLAPARLVLERRESAAREVAEYLRSRSQAESGAVRFAGLGNAGAKLDVYLPNIQVVRSKGAFKKLGKRARLERKRLYLVYGIDTVRARSWKSELVSHPRRFDSDRVFDGLDRDTRYHVVRAKAEGRDWTPGLEDHG